MKRMTIVVAAFVVAAIAVYFLQARHALISDDNILHSYGVIRENKLFDRKLPDSRFPINDFVAAIFLAPGAEVTYQLAADRATRFVQLSANDNVFVVSASDDNKTFTEIPLQNVSATGMWTGVNTTLDKRIHYLKLALKSGAREGAAYELLLEDHVPAVTPVALPVQSPPTYYESLAHDLQKLKLVRAAKIVLCGLFACAFLLLRRRPTDNSLSYAVIFLVGIVAFFQFSNPLGNLHSSEIGHYYLGTKYQEQVGYARLYDTIAFHEIRDGRSQTIKVRNLENYQMGEMDKSSKTYVSATANFDNGKLESFTRDWNFLRLLFGYGHHTKMITDHGYNGSPLYVTLLQPVFLYFSATRAFFEVMAAADLLLLIGGLVLLWKTYGAVPAALASLVIGLGEPWSFLWTAGSLCRYLWFFLFCLALYASKKKYYFVSGLVMTVAALLRIFPGVFLLTFAAYVVMKLFAKGEGSRERLPYLYGIATGGVTGLLVPLMAHGTAIYSGFIKKMLLHSSNESLNRISLDMLATYLLPSGDRILALIFKLLFLVLYLWAMYLLLKKKGDEDLCYPLSGLLIIVLFPLSSYDYIWLVALAPVIAPFAMRIGALFVMLLVTNFVSDSFMTTESAMMRTNSVMIIFLLLIYISYLVEMYRSKELSGT